MANFTLQRLIFESDLGQAKKKQVLSALSFFCFNEKTTICYPTIDQLAFATGYHRATIIRTIAQLVDDGLLETDRQYHQKNYTINVEKLSMLSRTERLYSPKCKVAACDLGGSRERLVKSQAATTLININNKNKGICGENLSTTKTVQYPPGKMSERMTKFLAEKKSKAHE